jgi:8-oxo-dGTP pyrophosphatase MutT (NUDIX family)
LYCSGSSFAKKQVIMGLWASQPLPRTHDALASLCGGEGEEARARLLQAAQDGVHPAFLGGAPVSPWNVVLADASSTLRTRTTIHVSTSAVVIGRARDGRPHTLLLWHARAREWVYPGGHADGDWCLLRSAAREVAEETGLTELSLLHPASAPPWVPAAIQVIEVCRDRPDQAHAHLDAVFVFETLDGAPSLGGIPEVIVDPRESGGFRWLPWPPEGEAEADEFCALPEATRLALRLLDAAGVAGGAMPPVPLPGAHFP